MGATKQTQKCFENYSSLTRTQWPSGVFNGMPVKTNLIINLTLTCIS